MVKIISLFKQISLTTVYDNLYDPEADGPGECPIGRGGRVYKDFSYRYYCGVLCSFGLGR